MTKICKNIIISVAKTSTMSWTDTRTGERREINLASSGGYFANPEDVDLTYDLELVDALHRSRPKFHGASYYDLIKLAAVEKPVMDEQYKLHRKGLVSASRIAMESACMDFAVEASEAFEAEETAEPWVSFLNGRLDDYKIGIEEYQEAKYRYNIGVSGFEGNPYYMDMDRLRVLRYIGEIVAEGTYAFDSVNRILDLFMRTVTHDRVRADKTREPEEVQVRRFLIDHVRRLKKKPEFQSRTALDDMIDPVKTITAYAGAVLDGVLTREQVAEKLGIDLKEIDRQNKADADRLNEAKADP